jgi:hypothetical protein
MRRRPLPSSPPAVLARGPKPQRLSLFGCMKDELAIIKQERRALEREALWSFPTHFRCEVE